MASASVSAQSIKDGCLAMRMGSLSIRLKTSTQSLKLTLYPHDPTVEPPLPKDK
jgi:hypothetical protein